MMSEEEGWIMHGMGAIKRIIKHEILTRYSYTNLAGHIEPWAYVHVLMSNYEQMLICSSHKLVRD